MLAGLRYVVPPTCVRDRRRQQFGREEQRTGSGGFQCCSDELDWVGRVLHHPDRDRHVRGVA